MFGYVECLKPDREELNFGYFPFGIGALTAKALPTKYKTNATNRFIFFPSIFRFSERTDNVRLRMCDTDKCLAAAITAFISYANFTITQHFLEWHQLSHRFKSISAQRNAFCARIMIGGRMGVAHEWITHFRLYNKIANFHTQTHTQNISFCFVSHSITFAQWNFASIALHLGMDLPVRDIREWGAFSVSSVCVGADSTARCTELN